MPRRVRRLYEKHRGEMQGLLLGRYPSFVRGSDRALESIPAFAFHAVSLELLEPLLAFLRDNDYATLTADEFVERASRRGPRRREVLLTFDDGHASLYDVAYPLLWRYGMRAVAFVVPGLVPERVSAATADAELCSWEQLRTMSASGMIDVQTHSMFHHSVAVSSRIIDFVRPDHPRGFLADDLVPMIRDHESRLRPAPLGAPLYRSDARYGRQAAFWEHPNVIDACVSHVASSGGSSFFDRPGWKRQLGQIAARERARGCVGAFESPEEQVAAILEDLIAARELLEGRLPGAAVRHLCLPWYRGSALVHELAPRAGYESIACGSILPSWARSSTTVPCMARLPYWYVRRLPGQGRLSMRRVLLDRARSSRPSLHRERTQHNWHEDVRREARTGAGNA